MQCSVNQKQQVCVRQINISSTDEEPDQNMWSKTAVNKTKTIVSPEKFAITFQ